MFLLYHPTPQISIPTYVPYIPFCTNQRLKQFFQNVAHLFGHSLYLWRTKCGSSVDASKPKTQGESMFQVKPEGSEEVH